MFTKQELELILALFESDAALVGLLERLGRPNPPMRIALLANLQVKVLGELEKYQQAEQAQMEAKRTGGPVAVPSPGDPEVLPHADPECHHE